MEIIINFNLFSALSSLIDLGNNPPIVITWIIIKNGGWFFIAWAILEGLWDVRMEHITGAYAASTDHILLAFKIPKESETNQQSPKAVEHIFSQIMGAYTSINTVEKYWGGRIQPKFSLEIISIEGYIQFLIRTPVKFRNLIESAFYAQYPEAEIFEVADYTKNIPIEKFPNEEYELTGSEIILAKDDIYPIKTYPQFEHPLTQELKDPLASLLESLSRLQKGEQLWLQIVITPDLKANKPLREKGLRVINKMAGKKEKVHENISDKGINIFMKTLDAFGEMILPLWKPAGPKKEELPSMMLHLTSGEKVIIEAIEEKLSKISFSTKIRFVYLAKKEVFDSKKGLNAVFGTFYQFFALNLNNLKPNSRTMIKKFYFFNKTRKNFRKTRLLKYFRSRERTGGSTAFMLNIEELATIFHFPILSVVKTPSIQKTKSKTAEPPFALPTGDESINLRQTFRHIASPYSVVSEEMKEKTPLPINLPIK
ncbi:hypothetical protein CVV26_02120 [Candidatus Kuenenbacteria bacterium HGW-Kuenenbacteria-1]|uniref:DUF8128 domain-containing protein n=1 Tax=Candidatus Kuenenbacteria bacterium HGW-Kuenenbacteria-1 TaxID=2013812 RepID=A0A2N1UNE1_9BACT|nr:MAG: hypothetical protein CVV26_02120 [Candidatus Kuenenbacteria bacterium HGW-Kuenenbacteria-1]